MKKILKEWVIPGLIGVMFAFLIKIFIFDVVLISGASMEPTFQSGDVVISEKVTKKIGDYEIGDIVIVDVDEDLINDKKIIKRIVGLEGDVISVSQGYLYRNGKLVKEEYIKEEIEIDFDQVTVPEGHVFIMGDNRNNSTDSRIIGPIKKENISGIVMFH